VAGEWRFAWVLRGRGVQGRPVRRGRSARRARHDAARPGRARPLARGLHAAARRRAPRPRRARRRRRDRPGGRRPGVWTF